MTSPLTLSFGSDHGGLALRRGLSEALKAKGYAILDRGTETEASCDYPDYAQAVGADVVAGRAHAVDDGQQRPVPPARHDRLDAVARVLLGVPARVAAGPGRTDCLPVDGHWNHNGNERAGAVLAGMLDPLLVTPGAPR